VPRKPENLETLRLALELLRRIPRRGRITASELHRQINSAGIERDLRTIQRQLKMFTEFFDIESDGAKPAGYRWKEHAQGMTVAALSEQQALLVALAQQQLRLLLPANVNAAMTQFFEQAQRNLDPFGDSKLARQWLSKVRVVSEGVQLLPPKIAPGVFEAVSQALYANLWLDLRYRNASGHESKVRVMPLGLAQQGPRMYLVCRYDGYTNERSLALHRIMSARAETLSFERPRDFDLARYDDDGRFLFGEGQRVELRFRIDAVCGAHLRETPLSKDQTIREVGDELIVTATVVDSEHLTWWLRGFGDNVRTVRRRKLAAAGKPKPIVAKKRAKSPR